MASTDSAGTGSRVVLWFRNDLRLQDNAIVHEAAQRVRSGKATEVIPVYCFDPRQFRGTPRGNPKTGAYRTKFLLESVLALQNSLRALGSDLLIANGTPEDVFTELAAASPAKDTLVLTQTEVTSQETIVDAKVSRAIKRHAGRLETFWGPTLYHLDDLPLRKDLSDLATVFTPFKQQVESRCEVRKTYPVPSKGALPLKGLPQIKSAFAPKTLEDLAAVMPPIGAPPIVVPQTPTAPPAIVFKGGEPEALARLQHYLWGSNAIADYFNTRNGMIKADDSTKFSPWLALGCISPRTIYEEVKKYERQRTANKSTYWVIFELTWRDYYRFFALRFGDDIFLESGITDRKVKWRDDEDALQRWKDGRTGMPLVDANMREMAQTGYMSNRGRQNVASYLALDLQLDWREGADWFESALVDYDVCSNWGNWVAAAGMTGGRLNQFNITKQSKDYDERGDYIRKWIPELKDVPQSHIHEPWRINPADRQHLGCADYPAPIGGTRYTGGGGGGGGSYGGGGGGGGGGGRGGRDDGRTHRFDPSAGRGGGGGGGGGRGRGRAAPRSKSQFDMYG